MDGFLDSCLGADCPVSCCSRGYGLSIEEFNKSFLGENKDELEDLGIKFNIKGDNFVWVSNCSNGLECKILKNFGDDGNDLRSLVCKVFPYKVSEVVCGDDSYIGIYLSNCPATRPNISVPETFTDEILKIVRSYYLQIYNTNVEVRVIESFQES